MIVERIWTGNAYRNFNYLIACPETGEALAIDPLDHEKCLNAAKVRGWQITQVLNTHEHHDHTGGNDAVIAATGAKLLAHHRSGAKIQGVDRGLKAGDLIKVGQLGRAGMPGHAGAHDVPHLPALAHRAAGAVLRRHAVQRRRRQLPQRRRPGALYATFVEQLAKLPGNTQVYPGHDYIENNLKFTLAREPDNAAAQALLPQVSGHDPATLDGHDAGRGEAVQHLLPPGQRRA